MSELKKAGCFSLLKQSDMNHTSKGVKNALYEIKKSPGKDPEKELTSDSICFLKKCFTYAVKQNIEDVDQLKISLQCIPYHVFGQHDKCSSWCHEKKDKENHCRTVEFHNRALFTELKKLFD